MVGGAYRAEWDDYFRLSQQWHLPPVKSFCPERLDRSRGWETCLFILGGSLQVESILEANFNQMEETPFSLPREVLSSLQSEDAALTLSLVENCGLELQGPGHQLLWDPDVVPQLSALYGSLAGLQLLANPSPAAPSADA